MTALMEASRSGNLEVVQDGQRAAIVVGRRQIEQHVGYATKTPLGQLRGALGPNALEDGERPIHQAGGFFPKTAQRLLDEGLRLTVADRVESLGEIAQPGCDVVRNGEPAGFQDRVPERFKGLPLPGRANPGFALEKLLEAPQRLFEGTLGHAPAPR